METKNIKHESDALQLLNQHFHVTGNVVGCVYLLVPHYYLLLKTNVGNKQHDKHNHSPPCFLCSSFSSSNEHSLFFMLRSPRLFSTPYSPPSLLFFVRPLIAALCTERRMIIITLITVEGLMGEELISCFLFSHSGFAQFSCGVSLPCTASTYTCTVLHSIHALKQVYYKFICSYM